MRFSLLKRGVVHSLMGHILELLNIHTAFHQGQYQNVIDYDISSLSNENLLPARVLQLRAQIVLGQADEVLAEVEGESGIPDLVAVKALAHYITGDADEALKEMEQLTATESDNVTVQVLGGTILQAAGKSEDALELLMKHQGSLEAYIYPTLSLDRRTFTRRLISLIFPGLP